MNRIILSVALLFLQTVGMLADEPQKFSPEKFQADMEAFMTKEAHLTEAEAAKFFPLFREMQQKQRAVFEKMKNECSVKPTDEPSCKKVVMKRDEYEIEQKKIQQQYHNKFFSVIPASKVYDVIMAESKFHRRAFKNWSKGGKGGTHPMKRK
ncbi:MAG: hypothetical protein IJ067_05720 [Prevotella sp.]|nr:hypothetical protein [Prevotella sp.]